MPSLAQLHAFRQNPVVANDLDDDADAKRWGRALQWVREKRSGKTQQQAATAMGIESAQGYAKYEAGRIASIWKPDTRRRLADALEVTVEELQDAYDRADEFPATPPALVRGFAEPAPGAAYLLPVASRVRLDPGHGMAYAPARTDSTLDLSWMFGPSGGAVRLASGHLTGLAENGDILAYDRARFPRPGELCLIETVTGDGFLYRFARVDGPTLHAGQTTSDEDITFAVAEVAGVYAIRGKLFE